VSVGDFHAPATGFRVLYGFLNMLVGMAWSHPDLRR
jgi:hypothetical protein